MSIGRSVRARLGRFEAPVSDLYRRQFIDLDACAHSLSGIVDATSILEVGCGDGQMASRLLVAFPDARYAGIDVAPEVGHLCEGDPGSCDVSIHRLEIVRARDGRALRPRGRRGRPPSCASRSAGRTTGRRARVDDTGRSLRPEGLGSVEVDRTPRGVVVRQVDHGRPCLVFRHRRVGSARPEPVPG